MLKDTNSNRNLDSQCPLWSEVAQSYLNAKVENITDLVEKMSTSEGLNSAALGAEILSNQCCTYGRSLQFDETLLEENNVNKVLKTSLVDRLVDFEADEATSKRVDEAPAVRSRLEEVESAKRRSKPTECWLVCKTSPLEKRRRKHKALQSTQNVKCSGSVPTFSQK